MNILYLLIGVSLLAAMVFLGLFIWAVKSGQYDDNVSPAIRILFDDEEPDKDEDNQSTEKADKNENTNNNRNT